LFCLEYNYDPNDIDIVLRIYQSDEILECSPDPSAIVDIMNTIVDFDRVIESLKEG
jgi:hypothetical protein